MFGIPFENHRLDTRNAAGRTPTPPSIGSHPGVLKKGSLTLPLAFRLGGRPLGK